MEHVPGPGRLFNVNSRKVDEEMLFEKSTSSNSTAKTFQIQKSKEYTGNPNFKSDGN